MPSLRHQALISLFEHRPELVATLLSEQTGTQLPRFAVARTESADLGQLLPTEYWADKVVLLIGDDGRPLFGLVLEVQLRVDARKSLSWPLYATGLRAKHGCPVCLVVVTPSSKVARWAAQPIDLGQPGSPFVPLVLGPDRIPLVTRPNLARGIPELAVLSSQVHGRGDHGPDVASAAFEVLVAADLDPERTMLYLDLVWHAASKAARTQLEELMSQSSHEYEFLSEFGRRREEKGRAEGVAAGRAEGVAEGRAEGVAAGRAEGEAKGRAEAILRVLQTRGMSVSDAERARLLDCTDLQRLDGWLDRALIINSASALFE